MESSKSYQEILKELETTEKGLTSEEARERLERDGRNELQEHAKKPFIVKFLSQFKDFLVIILIIAAGLSVLITDENGHRDWIESIVILVVVLLNAFLGAIQESKAEKSLESLKKLSSPHAKVVRDGQTIEISTAELVAGDVIYIEAGDFIPADARITFLSNLMVDESALTGESVPVTKTIAPIVKEHISLGDMTNSLFSSTFVTYGRGYAVITKTGMNTEIGKIAQMLNANKDEATPLQNKLAQIGHTIGILCIFICLVVFGLEFYLTKNFGAAFMTAISLAVASIPEGLATVVTVVLAIGMEKMSRRKAIVKKLPAVETLGCASIICSDKTGTLTQNKMTVVKIFTDSLKDVDGKLSSADEKTLAYLSLCTDASIIKDGDTYKEIGDPTETALIRACMKYVKTNNAHSLERVSDLPFDSDRKMMTVIVKENGRYLVITKGAPDVIINRSTNTVYASSALEANDQMASGSLRVLAVGYKYIERLPETLTSAELENGLQLLGLVGMIDPARPEVKDAIRVATAAGIRTIMITGDHIATAKAIAKELDILRDGDLAISSRELHNLSDEEFEKNIDKYSVYARVAPEDKVRIVETWQKKGHVVAMTGDGVNDSPALKKADIGCAMGITGTDVAKDAADLVLSDDNFETIVKAVEQGRGIYSNIKKVVKYLLSSNIGEVLTIFLASILAIVLVDFDHTYPPLLAMHLLWINLITDTLPAFALGTEEIENDVMKLEPRPKNEGFFAHGLGLSIFLEGIMIGLITLFAYAVGYSISKDTMLPQTMAFVTLATAQLFHAFNMKSERSIINKKIFNNKYLVAAFAVGFLLQIAIIYIPNVGEIFKVVPLQFKHFMLCVGLGFSTIVIMEISKFIKKYFLKK